MRFSWKALLLSPLPVPLITALLLAVGPGGNRFQGFLFFFALGCVFSYGATLVLFLPCLFVLSRFIRLSGSLTVLAGVMLGLAIYLPFGWQSYLITGDNSGPPPGSFAQYLWQRSWEESWIFCLSGLVTAMTYWLLARPSLGKRLEEEVPSSLPAH